MKDLDLKIVALFYALFGAFLGFLVFAFGTGGAMYVFTGRARSTWAGPLGFWVCVGVGAVMGSVAWWKRHHEFKAAERWAAHLHRNPLLAKRLVVIISSLVALYFIWQLAKGV